MNLVRHLVATCLSVAAVAANATVTYNYQGNVMTSTSGGQGSGIYARLEFSDDGAELLHWAIGKKDLGTGPDELTSDGPLFSAFLEFRTDAVGKVTGWSLKASNFDVNDRVSLLTKFNQSGETPSLSVDYATRFSSGEFHTFSLYGDPGAWTSTAALPNLSLHATVVPEPSSSAMLLLGLAGIASAVRARRVKIRR